MRGPGGARGGIRREFGIVAPDGAEGDDCRDGRDGQTETVTNMAKLKHSDHEF